MGNGLILKLMSECPTACILCGFSTAVEMSIKIHPLRKKTFLAIAKQKF